jgi:O-antigen/teichoic acid export membrane protein
VAARSLVEPALLTLGAGGLAWLGLKGGLLAAYLVAQLATLGVAVFGVARLYPLREIPRPNWSRMRRIAAQSAPTGLADCMNLAFLATGVVAVGHFLGDARLGIYGMAQNLETALSKIRQAFDMVVVPMVSQWMTDRSDGIVDQLRGVGRWILSAQLPVFVVILLLGDRLLGLLGKSFSSGAAVLSLLALAAVVDGTANLAQVPLFLRRPRLNSAIAAGMLATHIGLSFVLVPRLGLVGAGVSMAVAVTVAGLLRQLEIRRLFGRWLVNPALLKPIAAAAVGFAAAKLIAFIAPPNALWRGVSVAAFLVGYGLLLLAMEPDLRRRMSALTLGKLFRR